MANILSWLERHLLNQPLGIYLTLLLFNSYLVLVVTDQFHWQPYLRYFGILLLIFLPVLLVAVRREWLVGKVGFWGYQLLRFTFFVVYPAMVAYRGMNWTDALGLPAHFPFPLLIAMAGTFFLMTDLVLQFSGVLQQRMAHWKWDSQRSLERGILILVVVLALLMAGVRTYELMERDQIGNENWRWTLFLYSVHFLVLGLLQYVFYYINHYYLIPRVLRIKGVIYYTFSLAAVILVLYPILNLLPRLMVSVLDLQIGTHQELLPGDRGAGPLTVMLLTTPFIIGMDWFRQNSRLANLEKEKTTTELNLLKQQINPHFFFNTLNNLYALSLTKDPATPEVILQLSELMRYVIYRGKEETVALEEEVRYVEDYIQLQQIRLHQQLDLRFEKDIQQPDILIPPLLLITFVENAFKHGIEPAEGPASLHLKLVADSNSLQFQCRNSIEQKAPPSAGIGLTNLRRRLELHFPDRHRLTILREDHTFIATLDLEL